MRKTPNTFGNRKASLHANAANSPYFTCARRTPLARRLPEFPKAPSLQWSFMRQTVRPAGRLSGVVTLPGDKSISHRYAMIASLAEGASKITNYSTGADCHSTLGCVQAL